MRTLLLLLGCAATAIATACPDGWVSTQEADESRCYRFVEEAQNWRKAREICRGANGDLLSLRSESEKEWIMTKMTDYSTRESPATPVWHWWIGLNILDDEHNWMWSDESSIDESLIVWQPNQPDRATDAEKCGELHPSGINDNDCSVAFPYVCAKDKSEPESPCQFGELELGGACVNPETKIGTSKSPTVSPTSGAEPVQGSCSEGWVESPRVEDRCYRFETKEQSWLDAKVLCEFAHGELVSLRSTEERDWVRGQVQRVGHEGSGWFGFYKEPARPSWWTGLNKLSSNRSPYNFKTGRMTGGWSWADGQNADSSLLDWQTGEPNEYGTEDCGELHLSGFNDNQCSTRFPFICARPKIYVPDDDCPFGEQKVGGSCIKYQTGQSTAAPTTTPVPSHVPVQGDCPEGWESSPVSQDRCYRFESEKKLSWNHAQRMCQSARGELVSFRDASERDWVKRVVSGIRRPVSWWSGLNRLGSDALWRWSDDTPLDEENIPWQPREPNNIMEQCGEMHHLGMNDNGCWKKYNFICSRDKGLVKDYIECPFGQVLMGRMCEDLQIATPAPPPAGACTDGWIESPVTKGTCYRFVTDSLSASDAKQMCRAANADLLVIKTEIEQEWLQQQVQREAQTNGNWEFYMGLQKSSGSWQWVDGKEVSDISTVVKGSNVAGDCSTILPAGIQRDQCYSSKPYICTRPTELDPDVHACPWGETWKDNGCQHFQLHNYHTRVDYVNGLDVNRVDDDLQRLKGKHQRDLESLRQEFSGQIGNLTQRIQVLESALQIRTRTDPRKPILDFDPSLTLIISNLPGNDDEDPKEIVQSFFTDILSLTDVNVIHASRFGRKDDTHARIKVLLADPESKQAVMAARKRAKENPTYQRVRIVAAPMRLRPKKS